MEKIPTFNKRRAFNKAVGPGKNPKLINVGPTFIPDYRVGVCTCWLFPIVHEGEISCLLPVIFWEIVDFHIVALILMTLQ